LAPLNTVEITYLNYAWTWYAVACHDHTVDIYEAHVTRESLASSRRIKLVYVLDLGKYNKDTPGQLYE
jgi:hypothetical protein